MNVDAYVLRIAARLSRFGPLAARPLTEIRHHLVDSQQALMSDGATPSQAQQEAVRRFGDADEIAEQLAAVLANQRDPVERIVKIVSVTNVFTALWGLAATALLNPTSELLTTTMIVSVVIVAAALVCMRRDPDPGALVVSGVAVGAVGSAGILWALMGTRTGQDAQVGLALLMAVYCVQGVLVAWSGARRALAPVVAGPAVQ
jgi:hypothetical protein